MKPKKFIHIKPQIIQPKEVIQLTELPYKCYQQGELIAAFADEDHCELFKAELALHGTDIQDCVDHLNKEGR